MSDNTFYSEFVRDLFVNKPASYDKSVAYIHMFGQIHAAAGIAGEAGEVLDLYKKTVFTGKPFDRDALVKELGDVEFYLQALRNETGITREEVLNENTRKLNARHPTGNVETHYES